MKNYHFELEVKDNQKFMLIARLVDRDDFIADILAIRALLKLEITNRNIFDKKQGKSLLFEEKIELSKILCYVNKVIEKYNRSINYQRVILQAICTGVIKDEDLKQSSPLMVLGNDILRRAIANNLPQETCLYICIEPETNRNSLTKEVNTYLRKQKKENSNLNFILHDTTPNIKNIREWYWLWKKGMSNIDIAEKNHLTKEGDPERIKKAIFDYKENLKKYTNIKTLDVVATYQNDKSPPLTKIA
jgi:hypothetical protein